MNIQSSLVKNWTLLRYVLEITHRSSSPSERSHHHQSFDSSEGLLTLTITTTQQLVITRDETEKIECLDLLTSSIVATYTGDSLLISHDIPNSDIQRKFLVQFATSINRSGRYHCEECVTLLSRSIKITHIDSMSINDEKSHTVVTMADMIQALLGNDTIKLSNYYNQSPTLIDCQQANEFLEKYLMDETFPDFVANVASMLDTMKDTTQK